MQLKLTLAALAGLCTLLSHAAPATAQSSATCVNYYNDVNAAVARRDRNALDGLLKRPAAQRCKPEAQTARAAFDRLAAPPAPPVASPPIAPPVAPPVRVSPPPPPVTRADPAAEEAAAWGIARDTDSIGGYNAYLRRYPNGPNASRARQRIAALTPPMSPPPPPPPRITLDARTTPASTRAPLVTNPTSLPDFALFRECDGCPEMVVMPAGTFTMGSPATEAGRETDEGPQRNVSIRRFAISRFETTWDQWTACVNAGACNQGPIDTLIGQQTWARDASNWGRGQRPAIMVDWNDAAAFAIFVGGRAGASSAYRLPTEAEWEFAARAGTSTRWSFGDAESQLGAYAWFSGNASSKTQPVGGKAANPWGLFDMHGNVWEWVEDCYVNSYSGFATNGATNTTGGCADRVIRGGSWGGGSQFLRSASRGGIAPTYRSSLVGLRLSRTL